MATTMNSAPRRFGEKSKGRYHCGLHQASTSGGKTATAKGWSTAFGGSLQAPRNSGRIYFGGSTRKISRR
ncbi:hypothetical protein [Mesorhizobium sp.]|uniref:hypothetical protein n=1 Tax=Mesorhizobium sp. TaxID=1871066 RepID=UPI002579F0B3|nr:hypothetical protein [Mesorhizobium sp.]